MQVCFPPSSIRSWLQPVYGPDADLLITPFSYVASFGAVAASGTEFQAVRIAQNADFVITELAFSDSTDSTGYQTRVQITDAGTGDPFFNAPCFVYDVCSLGPNTQRTLPYPRLLNGASGLLVQLTADAVGLTNAYITLSGFKVRQLA